MFRHALSLTFVILSISGILRAENAADLLDPNVLPKVAPTPTPPVKSAPGTVDEPGFKATAKFGNRPEPDFNPLSAKGNNIAVPKRGPWSVPQEEGAVPSQVAGAAETDSANASSDKNDRQTETISPALAAIIAREKLGAKFEEVIPMYKAIAESEPQNAAAHYRLGLAQIRAREVSKGLAEMEIAIALEPRNTKFLGDYAIAALHAGWVEKAFATITAAVSVAPTNPRYLSILGEVHLTAGHATEAAEAYTRALKQDPKNANIYYNLGLVYMSVREYKRAAEIFSEALQLKPNTTMYFCSRGLAFENLKNFKMAIADYQAAMKADDKNPYAHYLYAGIFSDPVDPTYTNRFEAVTHAEKAVKLTNAKNAQYLMGLARALRLGRNYEEAAATAKRAVELEPGRVDLRQEWQTYERMKTQGGD